MATDTKKDAAPIEKIKALVLRKSAFGPIGAVVELEKEVAEVAAKAGDVDIHEDAISAQAQESRKLRKENDDA